MPGPDLGISDRCLFLNPGTDPNFWLSDDIQLNPATASPGVAKVGNNAVNIILRRKQECNVDGPVLIDLFVCNPSLGVVPPGPPANATKKITNVDPTNPDTFVDNGNSISSAGTPVPLTWRITETDTSKPDGPGHRCLVARCYPFTGSSPDTGDFHVQTGPGQGDPHVVQRNIEIVPGTQPFISAPFNAVNFDFERERRVIVRTRFDGRPNEWTRKVLLPMLEHIPNFGGIEHRPPRRFHTSVHSNSDVGIVDLSHEGEFEMNVPMLPGQVAECLLEADLSDTHPGRCHIFHLTQREENNELLEGGLTVVLVRL